MGSKASKECPATPKNALPAPPKGDTRPVRATHAADEPRAAGGEARPRHAAKATGPSAGPAVGPTHGGHASAATTAIAAVRQPPATDQRSDASDVDSAVSALSDREGDPVELDDFALDHALLTKLSDPAATQEELDATLVALFEQCQRFSRCDDASLHAMMEALSRRMASGRFVSAAPTTVSRTLALLQLSLLAFIARDNTVTQDDRAAYESATSKFRAIVVTIEEKVKKGSPTKQLRCAIPRILYRLACIDACLALLSDSSYASQDWPQLALAVVQTAFSFFGIGSSGAGTLASAAGKAAKRALTAKYNERLMGQTLGMWSAAALPPSRRTITAAMRTYGRALVDPSFVKDRWELAIAYMDLLHEWLRKIPNQTSVDTAAASSGASSSTAQPRRRAKTRTKAQWEEMTQLLLDGTMTPLSPTAQSGAGLSSAITFGRVSLKNKLLRSAWRPAEHLAYICQCIRAQPRDYPTSAYGWALHQIGVLSELEDALVAHTLKHGNEISAQLAAHRISWRTSSTRVEANAAKVVVGGNVDAARAVLASASSTASPPAIAHATSTHLVDETAQQMSLFARKCPVQPSAAILAEAASRFIPGTRQSLFLAFAAWSGRTLPVVGVDNVDATAVDSRVFWLVGDPGIGKSVFAGELARCFPALIVAQHACRSSIEPTRTANGLIRSLAHQLANRLSAYARYLLTSVLPSYTANELDALDTSKLWDQLLAVPLAAVYTVGASAPPAELKDTLRAVVLVDALDEAASELTDVLASRWSSLPRWLALAITSRPNPDVLQVLIAKKYQPRLLKCEQQENRDDIERYLRAELQRRGMAESDSTRNARVAGLLEKSGGLFLAAQQLLELSIADPRGDVSTLPSQVGETYSDVLRRARAAISTDEFDLLWAAVELAVCAKVPPSIAMIAAYAADKRRQDDASGDADSAVSSSAQAACVPLPSSADRVRSLLPRIATLLIYSPSTDTCAVYHKTVQEHFTSAERCAAKEELVVDVAQAHASIAKMCWVAMTGRSTAVVTLPTRSSAGTREDTGSSQQPDEMTHQRITLDMDAIVLDSESWKSSVSAAAAASDSAPSASGGASLSSAAPPSSLSSPAHLGSSWLRYGCCFGSQHAFASGSLALIGDFLCHPQYIHARALYQRATELGQEYDEVLHHHEQGMPTNGMTGAQGHVTAPPHDSPAEATIVEDLRFFARFFQQHNRRFVIQPELVYQYGMTFPPQSAPNRRATQLLPWLRGWPGRKCPIARWTNPPPVLSALMQIIDGHSGPVTSVAFSSDGRRIVSGSNDNSICVWDAASGAQLRELSGHSGPVTSVAFSSDGRRIVSGSWDRSIRVWDAASGAQLQKLSDHSHYVSSVAFTSEGRCPGLSSASSRVLASGVTTVPAIISLFTDVVPSGLALIEIIV